MQHPPTHPPSTYPLPALRGCPLVHPSGADPPHSLASVAKPCSCVVTLLLTRVRTSSYLTVAVTVSWRLSQEIYPPTISQFADLTDGACTADNMLTQEMKILEVRAGAGRSTFPHQMHVCMSAWQLTPTYAVTRLLPCRHLIGIYPPSRPRHGSKHTCSAAQNRIHLAASTRDCFRSKCSVRLSRCPTVLNP